jgi:hypothetical protein
MEEEEKKKEGKYIYPLDEISAIFGRKPQPMRDDPRSLAIPCFIGEVNIEAALRDFDSNINLMTLSLADRLAIGYRRGVRAMLLTLADHCEFYI